MGDNFKFYLTQTGAKDDLKQKIKTQIAFEKAAYKLEAGQVSDPIKSSYGYHIIKLTEKKELKPFDQEKDNMRKELEQKRSQDQQWQQQFFKELFKKVDVKITDKDLKDTFK